MYWLLLAGLLACFSISWQAEQGKVAAPSVIVSLCLSLATAMAILGIGTWNTVAVNLRGVTVAAILVGCTAFIGGCQLVNLIFTSSLSTSFHSLVVKKHAQNVFTPKRLTVLACIGLLATLIWYLSVSHSVGSSDPVALSSALKGGTGDFENSISTALRCYCYAGCAFGCAVFAWGIVSKDKAIAKVASVLILCTIVPPALSSLRTNLLHLFVGAIAAISMTRTIQGKSKKIRFRSVLLAAVGAYALVQIFYISVQFTGRVSHYNSPVEYFEFYLAGSIPALDYFLGNSLNPAGISETFWGVQDFLRRLGVLGSTALKASNQWAIVNYSYDGVTNIYTIVRPALHDFGFAGMALYMAMLGCFFQGLYRQAVTRHSTASFLVYSYLTYILVESMRDDFFSYWLGLEGIVTLLILLAMKSYACNSRSTTAYRDKRTYQGRILDTRRTRLYGAYGLRAGQSDEL